jgi:hypothetical protein
MQRRDANNGSQGTHLRLVSDTQVSRWVGLLRLSLSCCPCRRPPVVLCVSLARQPRGWGRRPGSEELGERVGVLQRPPRVLDRPLRPCPSETLHLVISSPIRMSLTISCFRARGLPFAPGSWPRSTPSGVGLTHARGRRPVEDRPPRVLSRCLVPLIISVVWALSLEDLSLSLFRVPPLISPVQGESHRSEFFCGGDSES